MASPLFEHFGDLAHMAVVSADREARSAGHPLIDTEHLLLGLLQADAALAVALEPIGLSAASVRTQIIGIRGADQPLGRGNSTFTDAFNETLQGASISARRKDHPVDCADLLVELLAADRGDAWRILARLAVDPNAVRRLASPPIRPGRDTARKSRFPRIGRRGGTDGRRMQ